MILAVVKVKVISIIGRMAELEDTTSVLGESCAFHPDNALSFYSDTSGFSPLNEENPYTASLTKLSDTLKSINKSVDVLSIRGVKKISSKIGDWKGYAERLAGSFTELLERRDEEKRKIADDTEELEKTKHFVGLDLNLDELGNCRFIKLRFGSLPKESYEKLNEYKSNPFVIFFPSSDDGDKYWGMYCSPLSMKSEVDRIFSSLYFERTRLNELTGTPESIIRTLEEKREKEKENIKKIDSDIKELWNKEKQNVQNVYSWLSEKSICYGIRRYAARYGDNFILTGWIPANKEASITAKLDKLETIKYKLEKADDPSVISHSPPVKLKNKKLFSPFEYLVGIYGLPAYNEVDPTWMVAITYFLFFGIMFADFGQGLCISLIGYLLYRKFKMPLGRTLIPCGISSAFFGMLFGSAFGFEHAFDPMYKHVFGLAQKPISVMEPETTNLIVYSAVGLGVVLVISAILMNIYSSLRRRNYTNAFFGPNGAAGLVFYVSIVYGLARQVAFGENVFHKTYVICLIVLPLVIMYFRDILGGLVSGDPNWKPESVSDYIMENFFEVFEFVLSYLTNTISFIRVGAFVLVHAGMMMVVFMLAEMTSGIFYALIIILGNVFVMALEGLLVSIQALRLEFYEMFSRFFDGDGRPFTPVVIGSES